MEGRTANRWMKYWALLPKDEKANVLTHALGLVLGLIVGPWMIWRAGGVSLHLWGVTIFILSLLAVYTSSTVYHSLLSEKHKFIWRKIDHICIYFLIAGTHTPFLLIYLPNSSGLFYLAILWGLVLFGIAYKVFFFDKWEWFSLALYLGMGWMAVFTLPPMLQDMPAISLHWIIFGGACYTLGVFFYSFHRLPYHHAIWHVFVLGGSTGHFMGVWMAL